MAYSFRLLSVAGVCALLFLSSAAEASCSNAPLPRVHFSVSIPEPSVTMSNQLWGKRGGDLTGKTYVALYPTVSSGKAGCSYISALEIKVNVTSQISISSRYPQGTCEYQIIKEHEFKHSRVLKSYFSSLNQTKITDVQKIVGGQNGFGRGESAAVQARMADWGTRIRQMLSAEHAQMQYQYVDDPNLVRQEQAKCRNWTPSN